MRSTQVFGVLGRLAVVAACAASMAPGCRDDRGCDPYRLDDEAIVPIDATVIAAAATSAVTAPEVLAIVETARDAGVDEHLQADDVYAVIDLDTRLSFVTAIHLLTSRPDLATPMVLRRFRQAAEHAGLSGVSAMIDIPGRMIESIEGPGGPPADPGPELNALAELHDEHKDERQTEARDLMAGVACRDD